MDNIKASVDWAWVTWVCLWSLNSCVLQLTRAAMGNRVAMPDLILKLLTPAQAANAVALHDATVWLGAAGAGPAFVAMLLSGRGRIRRALAGVGLASAAAIHCILAWLVGVTLVTAPSASGELLLASVVTAVGVACSAHLDVDAAQILLRRRRLGGEEE